MTTIIFGFALLVTLVLIVSINLDLIDAIVIKRRNIPAGNLILALLSAISWTAFYYLTH